MSLYEIDHVATQRRIEATAAGGLRALGETARSSAELDKQVRDMRERQEREKKAIDERVASARAPKPDPDPLPTRTPPKPSTFAVGGDEFREARQAKKVAEQATEDRDQDPPAQPAPDAEPTPRPKPRRPPAADGGDDMSGRTWLR